jgi:tetratricopeptide (TPR) repeat protein
MDAGSLPPRTATSGADAAAPLARPWFASPGLLAGLLFVVATATMVVHGPVLFAKATAFDDDQYWGQNALVQRPSWSSVQRFFAEWNQPSTVGGYYQPLTMTTLLVDWARGGHPGNLQPFHSTNLLLHVANVVLIGVLLYRLFGNAVVAALLALLFGLHPLTVEPVAWVSERKTLLSTCFALVALLVYTAHARRTNWLLYALTCLAFTLSLLAKPVTIPVPLLLLALDFWPLRRRGWLVVVDKLPLAALAALSAWITYTSQTNAAPLRLPPAVPAWLVGLLTIGHNVALSLGKLVAPGTLRWQRPYPEPFGWQDAMLVVGSALTAAWLLGGLIALLRTRAVLVGALFFLALLLPTAGLVGFPNILTSDKYVYLPTLGLLLMASALLVTLWGRPEAAGAGGRRAFLVLIVLGLAGIEAVGARGHLATWRDTETLYRNLIASEPNLDTLHDRLGVELHNRGQKDEALACFVRAAKLNPANYVALANVGMGLADQQKPTDALPFFEAALRLEPNAPLTHSNYGRVLGMLDRLDEAITQYEAALALNPHAADVHTSLGVALARKNELARAAQHFQTAIHLKPDSVGAYIGLGQVLQVQGQLDDAQKAYEAATRLAPGDPRVKARLEGLKAKRAAPPAP